jgi:predicted nucleic acid-binding protein
VATLVDTSALVVLLRRAHAAELSGVAAAARAELEAGQALMSVVTAMELVVGARDGNAVKRLTRLLDGVPVVGAGREIGEIGGRLGAVARWNGQSIPLPDLLIAATAIWLDVPLLTCDSDFGRGRALGSLPEPGPWAEFRLHPASVT